MKSLKSCLLLLPWFATQPSLWRCVQIENARRGAILIVGVVGIHLALGVPGWTAPHVKADFNGDGYEDLAIGVRGESVGPASSAYPTTARSSARHIRLRHWA